MIKLLKDPQAAPSVGQLYRARGNGQVFQCVSFTATHLVLRSFGRHLHGVIPPPKRVHTLTHAWCTDSFQGHVTSSVRAHAGINAYNTHPVRAVQVQS